MPQPRAVSTEPGDASSTREVTARGCYVLPSRPEDFNTGLFVALQQPV
jgi:hypothetical protein